MIYMLFRYMCGTQVIQESSRNHGLEENEAKDMPLLVYVSREKRPSHATHFKAGALNVLVSTSLLLLHITYKYLCFSLLDKLLI